MNLAPKAILVDLDGTLVDNTIAVAQTYYECLIELGLKPLPLKTILSFSGKSTYDTAKAMGVPQEYWDFVDSFFWDRFYEKISSPKYHVKLIPGAKDFLKKCKSRKVPVGVVTSNNKKNAQTILKKAEISKYIDALVTKDDVAKTKPDPEALFRALKKLGIIISYDKSKLIWFIGDSETDYLAAKNANITFFMLGNHNRRYDIKTFIDFHELMNSLCAI